MRIRPWVRFFVPSKTTRSRIYALEGLRNTVLAREYQLALPDERRLAKQIEETRHRLLECYNFFSSDDNYFSLSTTTIF